MKRTVVFPPCGASGGTSVKDAVTEAMSALKSGAYHDVAKSATAGAEELVLGNDPRLEDARSASDVFRWAKARTKPSYTAEEVGAACAVHDHPVATYAAPGFMSPADKKALKDFEQVIKKGGYVNDTDPRLSDARTPLEHTHDLATSVRAGFMSPQDKAKLDKVSTGEGASLTGAAGGVLAGEYPNPSFAVPMATLEALAQGLGSKVDKEGSKRLSTNDFTDELKEKLESLEGTHWKGVFNSLSALNASVSNPVAGDYADVDVVGEDVQRYIWDVTDNEWVARSGEVAPITAAQVKQLYESNPDTNAFTDAEKDKLAGIEVGATKNRDDVTLLARENHTGTQAINTVEGLQAALDAAAESGGISAEELARLVAVEDTLPNKADLEGGRLALSQMPDVAAGRKEKVADEAARLALDTWPDLTIAYQIDDGNAYALDANDDPSDPSNWSLLGSGIPSGVGSFNTRTGNVLPQSGDYTAEQITETAAKQFVTADQKAEWTAKETVVGAQSKATAAGQDAKDYADLTFIEKTQKGVADGVATLDEEGKVPTTQLALKTINGETVLGEGDIIIEAGGLDEAQLEAFLIGLGDGTLSGNEYVVMVNRDQDVVTRYSLDDLIGTIVSLVDTSGGGGGSGLDFEDRQKIDSIAFGATKNETDGHLLDRANHTGTIPMSVVENLEQELANIELGGMTVGETLRVDGIESSLALKADLDGSGKLRTSQLPDIASGRKVKVANETTRLLVTAHPDLTIAYQMDDGTSWVLNGGDDPSNPDNWTQLGSALVSGVTSFNTRTGNIMPQAGDYTVDMITETDEKQFVTAADKVSWNNRVPDAPFNGKIYGRKNGEWTIVSGTGGGAGSLSPQKEEELLERSNHTGTQGMETIDGLADVLNTKADIDTVYAEPMQTSYTIRTVNSTADQVHTFLLNGTNNSYGIHAYALRMSSSSADSYSLPTTIQPGGYYGVKIPRVNGITIESTGQGNEPHQRMTRHEEHGQTVTATSEHSATYAVWKMFQAGDTPSSERDNWYSSRAATPSDPQVATLTLPNAVKLGSYGMVIPYDTACPRTWTFEGRLGDEGDWSIIHEVTDETWDARNQRRDYAIPTSNQGLYDQYRWVITGINGNYFYIGRMFLYTTPAKFMIKDGDTFYSAASAELTPISGIIGSSDITVNGTDQQVTISQEAMETLSEPYIVTDEPITVSFSIDPENEYEYANDTKIVLANSYIRFSPTASGSYKFCYQEPTS